MNLLVIEDNMALTWRLKSYMTEHFKVQVANSAYEGLSLINNNKYDVIVLDLGLPDKNGKDVCCEIRKKGVATPILILTAEEETNTKVILFESGADDYLTKPFKLVELQARLKALARRSSSAFSFPILNIEDLSIDTEKRQVKRCSRHIPLRRKEFDILVYLARNQGQVVTRPMILERVWGTEDDAWNNTVDVHIKHLRDKVDKPFAKQLIKTAYGLGYMLNTK